jgi:hypothetical protein
MEEVVAGFENMAKGLAGAGDNLINKDFTNE